MIGDEEYKIVAEIVKTDSGIDLGESGHYLVDARFTSLAHQLKLPGPSAVIAALKSPLDHPGLRGKIVDVMTTNESHFFRDTSPFLVLAKRLLPQLCEARKIKRKIRIWSAACSTGQEPFSIAIVILENKHLFAGFEFEIYATDISERAVGRAKKGIFTAFEINRGLPKEYLAKYFTAVADNYEVSAVIKSMIKFELFNLIQPFRNLEIFDIIFCRNVLIYFNPELKNKVLGSLTEVLAADGFLIMGGAESASGFTDKLVRSNIDEGIIFQKASGVKKVA